ncbi:MAG: hypothetical protein D6722_27400 [Bacteroidetes bacterium]|nr:MAG: hypothetical protein D6722_27400 [Bacteroidota bacterium]
MTRTNDRPPKSLKEYRDWKNALDTYYAEGKEEGRKEGRRKAMRSLARQMRQGEPLTKIAAYTGLSEAEIEALS